MISSNDLMMSVRKLAKESHWQIIYSQSKEVGGIHLFRNSVDFTYLQTMFLNSLSFYDSLFIDIAMGEVDSFVLDDFVYEEAYVYYKNQLRRKKEEFKMVSKFDKSDKQSGLNNKTTILFKRAKKK